METKKEAEEWRRRWRRSGEGDEGGEEKEKKSIILSNHPEIGPYSFLSQWIVIDFLGEYNYFHFFLGFRSSLGSF